MNKYRFFNLFIIYFFFANTIVILLLSLLGYLGKYNMYLELLTNFKLQLFLLSLITAIFFRLKRHLWGSILALFCLVINSLAIVPWYIDLSNFDRQYSSELKILVFNVLQKNTQYAKTISLVKKETPDIAVFLEAKST